MLSRFALSRQARCLVLSRNNTTRLLCSAATKTTKTTTTTTTTATTTSNEATSLIPSKIVGELNRHIVGQTDAKRAVAVALRNRWRRHRLPEELKNEVTPKNILMIGPTGVGKTEIVRRVAKLMDSPFIKVEATKFTEVGFHGRDVDQIIRDLLDYAIELTKKNIRKRSAAKIEAAVEKALVSALCGDHDADGFVELLRDGALEDRTVELPGQLVPKRNAMNAVSPVSVGGQNAIGIDISALVSQLKGSDREKTPPKSMKVREARKILEEVETEKMLNQDAVIAEAIRSVENDGVVFIDEIDKICAPNRSHSSSGASDEGVQKDLLPLIEGSTVSTKHGNVQTDHILFVASGAFQSCKVSDLLAELQGRLPVRVELTRLTQKDLYKILTEPEHNLVVQQQALMSTEKVDVVFEDSALQKISQVAFEVNEEVENIGARRLNTILERVMEEVSFEAPELEGDSRTIKVDEEFVAKRVADMLKKSDLKKFIL